MTAVRIFITATSIVKAGKWVAIGQIGSQSFWIFKGAVKKMFFFLEGSMIKTVTIIIINANQEKRINGKWRLYIV